MNYYGSYDFNAGRSVKDKAFSFLIGCCTVAICFVIGFETAKNVVGWVNKEPVVSPIAGESGRMR